MNNYVSRSALLLLLISIAMPATALKTDRDQPTTIDADRVDVNDKKGISTFSGNVVMTRGSIKMTADKITVYRDKEKGLDSVRATGNPAKYKQRPDSKQGDVTAQAKVIVYDATKATVILNKSAKVDQEGNTFTGETITYDINKDQVLANSSRTATGSGETGSGKPKQRVRITLQPEKKP